MKTCLPAAAVSFVLLFCLVLMPVIAGSAEIIDDLHSGAAFRPARIRAFTPESDTSVIVREGRERYLRLTLSEACPGLADGQRLAFQVGPGLVAADHDGMLIPVTRQSAPPVISPATPHAYLVTVATGSRATCRLSGVAEVDRSLFEAAAATNGGHDNRYAGDGHSG